MSTEQTAMETAVGIRKFTPHLAPTSVPTPFGTIYAVPTSRDHVYFSTSGAYSDPKMELTVRGVSYSVYVHLFREPDGTWTHLNPADSPTGFLPATYRSSSLSM